MSSDIFTSRIDAWFADKCNKNKTAARTDKRGVGVVNDSESVSANLDSGKLEFGVSKVVRSIASHEAERRKRSEANKRA